MDPITKFLSNPGNVIPILIWVTFWKGWALWKAANKRQLPWFALILLVNTLGLLEIAYIFFLNKFDIDQGKSINFLESKFGKKK